MSIMLSVGWLDEMRRCDKEGYKEYQRFFRALTRTLNQSGLPTYTEPKDVHGKGWTIQVFPSNGIAFLQRLAIYVWRMEELPEPGTEAMDNPLEDPEIDEQYVDIYMSQEELNDKDQNFPHLVCHSPRGDFWIPVELDSVLIDNDTDIGSSLALKRECEWLADWIGLPLDLSLDDPDLKQSMMKTGQDSEGWKAYGIESYNCLLMHKASLKSIELNAAIHLH